jgi:hypothetical protein
VPLLAVDPAAWGLAGTLVANVVVVLLWVLGRVERRRLAEVAEHAADDASRTVESDLLDARLERVVDITEAQAVELARRAEDIERERRYRLEDATRYEARLEDVTRVAERERADKHGFKERLMLAEHARDEHRRELDDARRELADERAEHARCLARLVEHGLADRPSPVELETPEADHDR